MGGILCFRREPVRSLWYSSGHNVCNARLSPVRVDCEGQNTVYTNSPCLPGFHAQWVTADNSLGGLRGDVSMSSLLENQ
jgi:hypothetical protein